MGLIEKLIKASIKADPSIRRAIKQGLITDDDIKVDLHKAYSDAAKERENKRNIEIDQERRAVKAGYCCYTCRHFCGGEYCWLKDGKRISDPFNSGCFDHSDN